jgi:beta-phosphoglucomutase-like phosphatase (HAD superfamily)
MCAMPRAAIFDLDGVLLDTEPLYTRATQSIVGEFGKTYSFALKRRVMGGTAEQGAEIIVSELSLPISPCEYLSRRRRILERLFQTTLPIDGAEQLVFGLAELGLPLGIATSSERSLFELKTRNHSWFSRFCVVVCGDDPRVLHPKPAPDIFHLAARELRTAASDCIVFEDSPAGVLAASASGARVVARRDPAIPRQELALAHRIVERYAELELPASLDC